jgi:preprotein translocase subunit SecD
MNRRPHLTLVALIVAGLIGVGLLAVPGSPLEQEPTLGLDLQGGLEVTLQAVPPPNRPLQKSDLSRSVGILRDRVDRLGVAEPEIREQGSDQISIQLPGVKNPEDVIEILGKTAQLELFDLEANLVRPSIGVPDGRRPGIAAGGAKRELRRMRSNPARRCLRATGQGECYCGNPNFI